MKKLGIILGCLLVIFMMAAGRSQQTRKPIKKLLLIAHRGGVVDKERSENSLKALEEAIRRGYTHVEVDARCTKDGRAVCFHDRNLLREAGIDRNIPDMTLAEIKNVVLTRSSETIPTFEEYCARCVGRINLMVDIKGVEDQHLERFTRQIDSAMTKYGLVENSLFIMNKFPIYNQEKVADWFFARAKISWRVPSAKAEILKDYRPDPSRYNFIFNSPVELTKAEIDGFHRLGLPVIASVNMDHYKTGDPLQQGLDDVKKMLDYGVDGLQIDSCFDPVVFERMRK